MATLDELMDLKPAIENDVAGILTQLDIAAFTRQNAPQDFTIVRPRVEVKAQIGQATGRRNLCPDGQLRYDCWSFSLALQCVTEPQADAASNTAHELFVRRIRGIASTLAQNSLDDLVNFPNHVLAEPLVDTSTEDTLKSDDNLEYTVLLFDGKIAIRREVWPNN